MSLNTVTFYGTKETLTGWKKLVKKHTGRSCSVIRPIKDGVPGVSYEFDACINEKDCATLLKKAWYEKETKHSFPWNWRIGFKKSWEG